MTKQEIWIFGDSYADRFSNIDVTFSWPRELEKNYNVTNFGHSGDGPQGVLDNINKCILSMPNLDDKKVMAIVMLPEICRYTFSFYTKIKQRVYGQVNSESSDQFKDMIKRKFGEDKLKFLMDFQEYYLKVDSNRKIEEMKTFSLLNHYATYFKKMLVWPTDYVYVDDDPACRPLFSSLVNYDFVPITMETITHHREPNTIGRWPDDKNTINHLSLFHHKIMYTELVEWIESGKLPEDKFVYDPNGNTDGNVLRIRDPNKIYQD
jgi:hypothetical protein